MPDFVICFWKIYADLTGENLTDLQVIWLQSCAVFFEYLRAWEFFEFLSDAKVINAMRGASANHVQPIRERVQLIHMIWGGVSCQAHELKRTALRLAELLCLHRPPFEHGAAEFTGIDDGNSKQTINLKLKEDKKKGYFCKVEVAAGPLKDMDARYNTNTMFSSFKGKRKLSAFLLNGNTGQDGLSWQDMEKYGGMDDMNMEMTDDGGMMMWSGGGSADEEPWINTENGFITNTNAGLQYTNKFNENRNTLNLSPIYNSQLYNNTQSVYSENYLGGETFVLTGPVYQTSTVAM